MNGKRKLGCENSLLRWAFCTNNLQHEVQKWRSAPSILLITVHFHEDWVNDIKTAVPGNRNRCAGNGMKFPYFAKFRVISSGR